MYKVGKWLLASVVILCMLIKVIWTAKRPLGFSLAQALANAMMLEMLIIWIRDLAKGTN